MAEKIKERLLKRSKAMPGEDVTFRIHRSKMPHSDFERVALVDIQAGNHRERAAKWYPLWANNTKEREEFLKSCKKVSNFYILKTHVLHP